MPIYSSEDDDRLRRRKEILRQKMGSTQAISRDINYYLDSISMKLEELHNFDVAIQRHLYSFENELVIVKKHLRKILRGLKEK